MSLRIPLSVRLSTGRTDMHITRQVRDLSFRSVAVGGYASAAIGLDRPLNIEPAEIAYYARVYIYDARNGRVVWEGRLEDPSRSVTPDGNIWDLVAVGPSAHAHDRTVPLIYVDRALERWEFRYPSASKPDINGEKVTDGGGGVRLTAPRGAVIVVPALVTSFQHFVLDEYEQAIGRISCTWDTGVTDTDWKLRLSALSNTESSVNSESSWSMSGGTKVLRRGTDLTTGDYHGAQVLVFRATSNITIPDDNYWALFTDMVVVAQLKTKAGTDITTGYTANTVLASEVVADLLGRLLPLYDGAGAAIATTSFGIEQLAYPDGVTAARVLDDLLILEPAYRWGAWESNAQGKHRFEFSPWPTTIRYEADANDGYRSSGSADGLYNAVRVRYRDAAGQILTVRRTSTVAELSESGLTREGLIDLGDEVGTTANAVRAGDQWLAERAAPPNAGRLTIARPIYDIEGGRTVQPWEIQPGNLIRVRGIQPRLNALNTSTRDGVTVFKIVSHEYHTARAEADLELDSYSASTARALAELRRPSATRRR